MKKSIEKLIPFIEENFITFPLLEEGNYIPSVNIGFYLPIETKIDYDDNHIYTGDIKKDDKFIIFINQDIPMKYKRKRYVSFGVSYVDGTEEKDIRLEPLYELASKIIIKYKH